MPGQEGVSLGGRGEDPPYFLGPRMWSATALLQQQVKAPGDPHCGASGGKLHSTKENRKDLRELARDPDVQVVACELKHNPFWWHYKAYLAIYFYLPLSTWLCYTTCLLLWELREWALYVCTCCEQMGTGLKSSLKWIMRLCSRECGRLWSRTRFDMDGVQTQVLTRKILQNL